MKMKAYIVLTFLFGTSAQSLSYDKILRTTTVKHNPIDREMDLTGLNSIPMTITKSASPIITSATSKHMSPTTHTPTEQPTVAPILSKEPSTSTGLTRVFLPRTLLSGQEFDGYRIWATSDMLDDDNYWWVRDLKMYDNLDCKGKNYNDGTPVNSGHIRGSPASTFDSNGESEWVGTKDKANGWWLGMVYDSPRKILCISYLDEGYYNGRSYGADTFKVEGKDSLTGNWKEIVVVIEHQAGQRNDILLASKSPGPSSTSSSAPSLPLCNISTPCNSVLTFFGLSPDCLLPECAGHCNIDSDCANDLFCFQSDPGGTNASIPGCETVPYNNINYCVADRLKPSAVPSRHPTVRPSTSTSVTLTRAPSELRQCTPVWTQLGNAIDTTYGYFAMASNRLVVAVREEQFVKVYRLDEDSQLWTRLMDVIDPGFTSNYALVYNLALSSDGGVLAISDGEHDSKKGRVQVFTLHPDKGWVQVGLAIDGESYGDRSGQSIAVSADGTVVAIAAPYNDGNGKKSGHVRVFSYDFQTQLWVQRGKNIDGEAIDDRSGWSIAMSADGFVVATGTRYNDGNGIDSGHMRIFGFNIQDESWIQRGDDLDGEASGDSSGWSVAMSADGSVIAIGAGRNSGNGYYTGHVRVYKYNFMDQNWGQRGDDIDGEAEGDFSGYSVAMSADGNIIAITAPYNDGNGYYDTGHLRLYHFDILSKSWVQHGEDLDGDAAEDYEGYDVSISADGTVVGTKGLNSKKLRILKLATCSTPPLSMSSISPNCVEEVDLEFNTVDSLSGFRKVEYLGNECCKICLADVDCNYAFSNDNDCYVSSYLHPDSVKLLNTERKQSEFTAYWMDDISKRGDFCTLCICRESDHTIDCRGQDIAILPKSFSLQWTPYVLDLRDNARLCIIGAGALSAISDNLKELRLPTSMRYLSDQFVKDSTALKVVSFEGVTGEDKLNNVISSQYGFFGDKCCGHGGHLNLTTPADGLVFCNMEVNALGIDSFMEPFWEYSEAEGLSSLRPSSSFMAEAAESLEKCAEYCAMIEQCHYFTYDARRKESEYKCNLLRYNGTLSYVCCDEEDFADDDQSIPGLTSGRPPRTRHDIDGAKILIRPQALELNPSNDYKAQFSISLGSMPLRGAVWVEPKVSSGTQILDIMVSPMRIALYDDMTVATVTINVLNPGNISTDENIIISNIVDSCDVAFTMSNSLVTETSIDINIKAQYQLCPPGSYWYTAMGSGRCKLCEAGSYQPKEGATTCITCGRGTFQDTAGQTECKECHAGGYCDAGKNGTYYDGFTPCKIGTYNSKKGQYNETVCLPCPRGTFSGDNNGLVQCFQCPYRLSSQGGDSKCNFCAAKFYLNDTNISPSSLFTRPDTCKACPPNANCIANTTIRTLQINKGFWRDSNVTSIIYPCSSDKACIGSLFDIRQDHDFCRVDHMGPRCEICMKRSLYFSFFDGLCVECPFIRMTVSITIIITAGICIAIGYHLVITRVPYFKENIGRISYTITTLNLQAKLKIILSSFQVLGALDSVYGVQIHVKFKGFSFLSYFNPHPLRYINIPQQCLGSMRVQLLLISLFPFILIFFWTMGTIAFTYLRKSPTDISMQREKVLFRSVHVAIIVIYVSLPAVCNSIFDAIRCKSFATDDNSGKENSYLVKDWSVRCDKSDVEYTQLQVIFWVLFTIWTVTMPSLFAALLWYSRNHITLDRITGISESCRFLWLDYNENMIFWDVLDIVRKIILTGLILFVDEEKGSERIFRLVIAIAVSVIYLGLLVLARPYKHTPDLYLSFASNIILIGCFLIGIMINICKGDDSCQRFIGIVSSYEASLLVVVLMVGILFISLISIIILARASISNPTIRVSSTGSNPNLDMTVKHQFHAFLSYHVCSTGQDKIHKFAKMIRLYLPGVRIWTNVDEIQAAAGLEELIKLSEVFILFYSIGYFKSAHCRKALTAAVAQRKPTLLLYEGDKASAKVIKVECKKYFLQDEDPDGILRHILDEDPILWLGDSSKPFAIASVKLVVLRLLQNLPYYSKNNTELNEGVKLGNSLDSSSFSYPPNILFCNGNEGVKDIIRELQEKKLEGVFFSDNENLILSPEPGTKSGVLLLYLNKELFQDEDSRVSELVEKSLEGGRKIILIWERDSKKGACEFSHHISQTPQALLNLDMFDNVEVPLYAATEQRTVSIYLLLKAISNVSSS